MVQRKCMPELGIGTLKVFTTCYNIDISLTIRYLYNTYTILPASHGHNFVKFTSASFGISLINSNLSLYIDIWPGRNLMTILIIQYDT